MKNINLNPQDDFVLERVGILVAGEENVGILQQLMAQHVPQSVILLWTRMGKGFQESTKIWRKFTQDFKN